MKVALSTSAAVVTVGVSLYVLDASAQQTHDHMNHDTSGMQDMPGMHGGRSEQQPQSDTGEHDGRHHDAATQTKLSGTRSAQFRSETATRMIQMTWVTALA
jgi:hypothetical protein